MQKIQSDSYKEPRGTIKQRPAGATCLPHDSEAVKREEAELREKKLFKDLVDCVERGLDPQAAEVQQVIKKHYNLWEQIHFITKEVYKVMAQLYVENHQLRTRLDSFHPRLAEFMSRAMEIFADRTLS